MAQESGLSHKALKKLVFFLSFISAVLFLLLIFTLYRLKMTGTQLGVETPQTILEYKLDEGSGTTANDTSGNGNNGTLAGQPTWETGKFGSSLQFKNLNSPEDYVNGGSNASLDNLPQADFTVENWVKFPAAVSGTKSLPFGIANKLSSPGSENGWWFNVTWQPSNVFELYYYNKTSGGKVNSIGTTALQINKWHHMAMVYNSTEKKAKLYFDGAEVAYTKQQAGAGSPADDSAGDLRVGRYRTTNFPHRLDDLHIYNYARTAEQIASDASIVNVKEFGAVGDGVTEDQVAFQAAIDYLKTKNGGKLYIPTGTYILHKPTTGANGTFNIKTASNIELYGDGATASILKRKDVAPVGGDIHIVRVINSNNIKFHDLGFDGSRDTGTQDQMHGIYVLNSSNVVMENLKISRFRGSGTYLMGDNGSQCPAAPCFTTYITVKNSIFYDNYRAGSANQGGIKNITYQNNSYDLTLHGQDIDFEATGSRPGAEDVLITGNTSSNNGGSIALTLGGTTGSYGKRFTVTNNTFNNKGVQIGKLDTLTFSNNTINSGSARAILIIKNTANLNIKNNTFTSGAQEVLHFTGQNNEYLTIEGNTFYLTSDTTRAIYGEGVSHHIKALNNNIVGPTGGSQSSAQAILMRNVSTDGVTRIDFQMTGNKFWRTPTQIKFKTTDTNNKFQDVTISDNIYFYDGGGNFVIDYDPSDPSTWIINLTTNNNTVQAEIPDP